MRYSSGPGCPRHSVLELGSWRARGVVMEGIYEVLVVVGVLSMLDAMAGSWWARKAVMDGADGVINDAGVLSTLGIMAGVAMDVRNFHERS